MTTTSSATAQALLLQQLLQQQQLQQTADAKATADAQATKASSTVTSATAASIDTTQQPQVASPLSAALSQLGSNEDVASSRHDRRQHDHKVGQVVQNYIDQGPSSETDLSGPTKPAA